MLSCSCPWSQKVAAVKEECFKYIDTKYLQNLDVRKNVFQINGSHITVKSID